MKVEIISAAESDFTAWRGLWRGYLDFYDADVPDWQTALTWDRFLDPSHPLDCLVARDESGAAVGFATYFVHPSTWLKVGDCYLEDLFVSPGVRGGGVGRSLISGVETRARYIGCERLYWFTNHDNDRARALYDKIAGPEDGHVRYRMRLIPPA